MALSLQVPGYSSTQSLGARARHMQRALKHKPARIRTEISETVMVDINGCDHRPAKTVRMEEPQARATQSLSTQPCFDITL